MVSLRAFLTQAAALLGLAAFAAGQTPPSVPAGQFYTGADISMLPHIEKAGGVFRDAGQARDAIGILCDHGVNLFRLRLFVQPNPDYAKTHGATQNLDDVRAMARRIKASGAQFLLDLHYSDTWADPAHQSKPAAWEGLGIDALEQKVHDYTAQVLTALKDDGTPPDIVQIGNEIAAGMLWPDGKLDGKTDDQKQRQWQQFARLLKAGVKASRAAQTKDHPIRIAIHIHGGGRKGLPQWFFANLARHELDFDIIALSFYPLWDESIEALRDNLADLARTYSKDIIIMETAYPWRKSWNRPAKPSMAWPLTPQGQDQFLGEVLKVVRGVPDHKGCGVVWWYPESLALPKLGVWENGDQALFDDQGNPLPALLHLLQTQAGSK